MTGEQRRRWIDLTVLLLAACLMCLNGCRSYLAYYGHDSLGGFVNDLGCIRENGVNCEDLARNAEDDRVRAAVERAIVRQK